jgi:hypothetical protein
VIRRNRNTTVRTGLRSLVLGVFLLGLTAAPAFGDTSWGISLSNEPTSLPRSDERMVYKVTLTNTGTTPTVGPYTAELELPGGSDTSVFGFYASESSCSALKASGSAHASGTCTRTATLGPDGSTSFEVVARLGPDSEEPTGTAVATVSGGGATLPASDDATYTFTPGLPFGIAEWSPGDSTFEAGVFDEAGDSYNNAGGHPLRAFTTFGANLKTTTTVLGNHTAEYFPVENVKDTVVDAPRGFVGNALTTPELCPTVEEVILGLCPEKSIVGGVDVYAFISQIEKWYLNQDLPLITSDRPLYSIEPEFGAPAQFAFGIPVFGGIPYTFVPELRADEGYAIRFRTAPIITAPPLHGTNVDICSFGVNVLPSVLDGASGENTGIRFGSCKSPTDPDAYPHPLITNPTRCSGPPPTTGLKVDSWDHPADVKSYEFSAPEITGCGTVDFEPEAELQPTNHEAESPTGLDVEIKMPTDGLLSNTGVAQANLDNATVSFPQGMAINGAAADGLQACGPEQVKLHSNLLAECPQSSKVGRIEIDTPIIRETLHGDIYIARQNDNPFRSTLGVYLVFASARDGVTIKVAGKLTPDPATGQLVATFVENVEAPFSRIAMHFNSGPRAPLVNPPRCGTYAIHSEFSPWSAVDPAKPTPEEVVSQDSSYEVTSGPNGSSCPVDALSPKLSAGLEIPKAGVKSPFFFTLSRDDGTQRFSKIEVRTPKGLTAYLKGIPYCPDSVLNGIPTAEETGRAELIDPACPAASQVGTVRAGAGSGPFPFYAPGKAYLAGPYKGAPVSLAIVTPAVAGPLDLGNVVVRNPIYIDPVTSQVTTTSDPIPSILHGIVLAVRAIRVALDHPNFTAAPTSCTPTSVDADVSGLDGGRATASSRFQVGSCADLGFKPKLALRLFGGTRRGAHPRLQATLTARPGDANIAGAVVALPRSEFLDQAHIRTICTRVQFADKACPPGSVYGHAEATTPLLDSRLTGPVYLRSSSNTLPDLVVALRGPDSQPIEVVLASRVDSVAGGIRSSFEALPDQPVSSFTLSMLGGKKGLLVNSRDICKSTARVTVSLTAQNGRTEELRPKLRRSCKKTHDGKKKRKAGKRARHDQR